VSTAAPYGRMFPEHDEGGGGQLCAAEVRPGCNRGRCWMGSSRGSGSCCGRFRGCRRRQSRSGSASRSDSLIEFVKTNVAILPLLILTATTNSDELSYGLNNTAVDGFWIGSNWASTGEAPLADTLASIMDSAPYDGAAACADEGKGDQLQMILDRPARGREPGPLRSH
jgi:hypothetical protein